MFMAAVAESYQVAQRAFLDVAVTRRVRELMHEHQYPPLQQRTG